jgi:glycine/D-amino acid oxidase-like deaminating enzyme
MVIGAGVVGAAVAAALTRRGAEVTVLDAGLPGTGTTATSYAWVNANNKDPLPYF